MLYFLKHALDYKRSKSITINIFQFSSTWPVNIVPVIAKSDTLTKKELLRLKQRVMNEINGHGIQTYDIPECEVDEDEDFKRQNQQLREAIPFAVCGANQIIEVRGKKVRGRMYPWGVVEGERGRVKEREKVARKKKKRK